MRFYILTTVKCRPKVKEECLCPQETVSLEALIFLSEENKWPENTLLFCPLHCAMDEEAQWFLQGLSFNFWAIASEIGCCCCLPVVDIVHLEVWTILGFVGPHKIFIYFSSVQREWAFILLFHCHRDPGMICTVFLHWECSFRCLCKLSIIHWIIMGYIPMRLWIYASLW